MKPGAEAMHGCKGWSLCGIAALVLAAPVLPVRADGPATNSFLAGFRLVGEPHVVEEIFEDLSGITCNPITGTLLVIRNGEPRIVELDPDCKRKRVIDLVGYEDTEDLTCLPDGRVVDLSIEEGRIATVSTASAAPARSGTAVSKAVHDLSGRLLLPAMVEPQIGRAHV